MPSLTVAPAVGQMPDARKCRKQMVPRQVATASWCLKSLSQYVVNSIPAVVLRRSAVPSPDHRRDQNDENEATECIQVLSVIQLMRRLCCGRSCVKSALSMWLPCLKASSAAQVRRSPGSQATRVSGQARSRHGASEALVPGGIEAHAAASPAERTE